MLFLSDDASENTSNSDEDENKTKETVRILYIFTQTHNEISYLI